MCECGKLNCLVSEFCKKRKKKNSWLFLPFIDGRLNPYVVEEMFLCASFHKPCFPFLYYESSFSMFDWVLSMLFSLTEGYCFRAGSVACHEVLLGCLSSGEWWACQTWTLVVITVHDKVWWAVYNGPHSACLDYWLILTCDFNLFNFLRFQRGSFESSILSSRQFHDQSLKTVAVEKTVSFNVEFSL